MVQFLRYPKMVILYTNLTVWGKELASYYFLLISKCSQVNISILLGPPGCAEVFPYLSPGPLDFLVV